MILHRDIDLGIITIDSTTSPSSNIDLIHLSIYGIDHSIHVISLLLSFFLSLSYSSSAVESSDVETVQHNNLIQGLRPWRGPSKTTTTTLIIILTEIMMIHYNALYIKISQQILLLSWIGVVYLAVVIWPANSIQNQLMISHSPSYNIAMNNSL